MKQSYPIHEAVLTGEIRNLQLIDCENDLNKLDKLGHSPLHWAVFGGYLDIVAFLLEKGAKPNIVSDDGVTPLWRAKDFGLIEIQDILIKYGGKE
ncbi:MAG: ankyrin repeat protein [Arenicella sp.]|jgi:ankyrin repeat protein